MRGELTQVGLADAFTDLCDGVENYQTRLDEDPRAVAADLRRRGLAATDK